MDTAQRAVIDQNVAGAKDILARLVSDLPQDRGMDPAEAWVVDSQDVIGALCWAAGTTDLDRVTPCLIALLVAAVRRIQELEVKRPTAP